MTQCLTLAKTSMDIKARGAEVIDSRIHIAEGIMRMVVQTKLLAIQVMVDMVPLNIGSSRTHKGGSFVV